MAWERFGYEDGRMPARMSIDEIVAADGEGSVSFPFGITGVTAQDVGALTQATGDARYPLRTESGMYSVVTYGATGGSDDTTAIQAAITAGAGKTVFFPPGTYSYTTLAINASNTRLVGSGYGETLLKQIADGDGLTLNVGGGSIANSIEVSNMLLGASADRASGAALRLGNVGFCRVSNVRVSSALSGRPFEGLRIDRASDSHFADFRTAGCASHGAILQPGSASSVIVEIYFDDECEFRSGLADGMYLLMDQAYSAGVCSLEGIHSAAMHYNNAKAGVRINAAHASASPRNLHFNGASYDSNAGTSQSTPFDGGFVAEATVAGGEIRRLHVCLEGGWCSFNGGRGIYLANCKDYTVCCGTVRSNNHHGVDIQSSNFGALNIASILGNGRSSNDAFYGLQLGGSSQYISVRGKLDNPDDASNKQRGVNFGSTVADIDITSLSLQNQVVTTVNQINGLTSASNLRIKLPKGGTSSVQTGVYTVANDIDLVKCDTTSAGFTVTLPRAAIFPDREITVKRTAGANTVTIAATAGTVETTSVTTTPVRHRSDGTNWIQV